MRGRLFSSEGIVLARRNFSEADRLVTIFSENNGKITLIAKGVRKPKSRKRGSIEIFSRIKFSGSKTNSLPILTEVENIQNYQIIRSDLKKTSLAYYFIEVVNKISREDEVNRELYQLLIIYLDRLEKEMLLRQLRLEFIQEILEVMGFWPKGKRMDNPDKVIIDILERKINSHRVGKLLVQ
jgi:DNA repair protein RecO (recombination protein O)